MVHRADLAVDHRRRPYNAGAICHTDRLVAEAHAEHRHSRAELSDEVDADPCLLGNARAGRHHDRCGIQPRDIGDGQGVVSLDGDRRTEFPQVLHEVERERVVVVDDQHLAAQRRAHAFASSTARICAATLLSISTVSSRADESATMPAAACTYAISFRITMVRSAIAVSRSPP